MIDSMTLDSEIADAIEAGEFEYARRLLEEGRQVLSSAEYRRYSNLIRVRADAHSSK